MNRGGSESCGGTVRSPDTADTSTDSVATRPTCDGDSIVACVHLQTDVAWWRHAVLGRRTHDQTDREFDTRLARDGSTTLGKLFTPVCLDADCLRYCTESLNRVPGYLHHLQTDVEAYTHTHTTATMLAAVLKAAAAVVFTQLLMDSR